MDLPTSTQFQHHYCQVTTFVKHVQNNNVVYPMSLFMVNSFLCKLSDHLSIYQLRFTNTKLNQTTIIIRIKNILGKTFNP